RCVAPCDGGTTPERYGELVRTLISSLSAPGGLLEALERRMHRLAEGERFEEAALARDRLRAVAEALSRHRTDAWLTDGRVSMRDDRGTSIELGDGALDAAAPLRHPCPRDRADELSAVRSWVTRHRPA